MSLIAACFRRQALLVDLETSSEASTRTPTSDSASSTSSKSSSKVGPRPRGSVSKLRYALQDVVRSVKSVALGTSTKVAAVTPAVQRSGEAPTVVSIEILQPAVSLADQVLADLFYKEHLAQCKPGYLTAMQPDLDSRARSVLVDWLVEIHEVMTLTPSSLFLGICLLDRYLSKRHVKRAQLQLVGTTCLLLAAKFEELDTDAPTPDHFQHFTQGICAKVDIVKMECRILAALAYEVMVPTCQQFFEVFQQVNKGDTEHSQLVSYILELSLQDASFSEFQPSHIAAAAVLLANQLTCRQEGWSLEMASITRHAESSLAEMAKKLSGLVATAPTGNLTCIMTKYSKKERLAVAKLFPKSL